MQKTWTYNKIRHILDAASEEEKVIGDLAESLRDEHDCFVYYRRGADGAVREHPCSSATIRQKIEFCIELGLINRGEMCSLTDSGDDALETDRFDLVLQQAVLDYLGKNNVSFDRIETAIDRVSVPDPHSLYVQVSPGLSEERFRTCLFLLSQCGEDTGQNLLKGSVRKVYLT